MASRDYYRGPIPPLPRSHQQIMDMLARTEPKSGGAAMILRWLTQAAAIGSTAG